MPASPIRLRIEAWDAGGEKLELPAPARAGEEMRLLALSPDGTQVLMQRVRSDGQQVRDSKLWDVAGGQEADLLGPTESISAATYSADGPRLLSYDQEGTLTLWDAVTRQELCALREAGPVASGLDLNRRGGVFLSPDGVTVVRTSDRLRVLTAADRAR